MNIKIEYCDELVDAIINQAMQDYVNSVRKLPKLKHKLTNCGKFRKRYEGETLTHYRNCRFLQSPKKINSDIEQAEQLIKSSEEFLLSRWLEQISDVDGEQLLEELDKQLRLEGYEV